MFNFSLNSIASGEELMKKGTTDRITTKEDLNTEMTAYRKAPSFSKNRIHPDSISNIKKAKILEGPHDSPSVNTPILDFHKAFSFNKIGTLAEEDKGALRFTLIRSVILAFFEFCFEVLAVVNLILMTYYRLNYLQDKYSDTCYAIEIVICIYFIFETLYLIHDAYSNGSSYEFLFRFSCNFFMIFQICWMFSNPPFLRKYPDASILINTIRSFRIFGIKKFFLQIKKTLSNDEGETESLTVQMSYFAVVSLINIISAIFIQATLFLSFDALENYQGYTKQTPNEFEYIAAMYFSMSTITTIGYGDIYPLAVSTRIIQMFILFLNLSVVSIFLGKLTDVIYVLSPYIKQYRFKNHLIIIGDLPMSYLRYFLMEIQASDKMQRNLMDLIKFNEKQLLQNVLIIDRKKPSVEMEILMDDESFEFEIQYLMDDMSGKNWLKLSNLKFAKHLFLFSLSSNENDHITTQKDLSMIAMAKMIEMEHEIPMTLVLSTEACENFASSFSNNVTVISHKLINNQIIANSLENQGYNTWLTHLMTLREKHIPFESETEAKESNFFRLYEYAQNMTQEIYTIKFSPFFFERRFREVVKMLYFSQTSLVGQEKMEELDSPDLIKHKRYQKGFTLLLIGIEQSERRSSEGHRLLINPLNYTIKNGDIGYFVAQSRESAIKALHKISSEGAGLLAFETLTETYEKSDFMDQDASGVSVPKLYENLQTKNKNWQINIPPYFNKKDNIFDLNLGDSIRGFFDNHIIMKASLLDFKNILNILRFYSDRPIIIYSEDSVDSSKWNKLKDSYRNIFYVKGTLLSLNHISELEPRKASKVLIMSQSKDSLFLDADTVVFARILKDFFKVKHILVELVDESMIRFLEIKPKFNLINETNQLSFFWPSFVSAQVHYNSVLMSLVARSVYNPNWIFFFKELSNPKIYTDSQMKNEKVIKQNSNLCMLKITKEIANSVVIYGKLQFLLMSNDPPIIGLGLVKKRKNMKGAITQEFMEKMRKSRTVRMSLLKENLMETVNSVYGTTFFLTNPPYFTKLAAGDRVLVLGMQNLTLKIKDNEENKQHMGGLMARMNRNKIANLTQPKNKRSLLPISEVKKKNAEMEFKAKFKTQAIEMLSGLNETMKKSLDCMEMLNKRDIIWKKEKGATKITH